jgi:phytoene dehydrogenase-like protein
VIGAGISGIASAKVLSKANIPVKILEARNRTGGRIHTEKALIEGTEFIADLGASWIHGLGPGANDSEKWIGQLNPIYIIAKDHEVETAACWNGDRNEKHQILFD